MPLFVFIFCPKNSARNRAHQTPRPLQSPIQHGLEISNRCRNKSAQRRIPPPPASPMAFAAAFVVFIFCSMISTWKRVPRKSQAMAGSNAPAHGSCWNNLQKNVLRNVPPKNDHSLPEKKKTQKIKIYGGIKVPRRMPSPMMCC